MNASQLAIVGSEELTAYERKGIVREINILLSDFIPTLDHYRASLGGSKVTTW